MTQELLGNVRQEDRRSGESAGGCRISETCFRSETWRSLILILWSSLITVTTWLRRWHSEHKQDCKAMDVSLGLNQVQHSIRANPTG